MLLSIIIPCYNEERTIAEVLQKIQQVSMEHLNIQKEVIVVDDGSTDMTWKILEGAQKQYKIKLLRHEKNCGKGRAIRSSLKLVAGDIVLIQDADLEYSPEDYPLMLQPFLSGQAEVVYGSRFLNSSHPDGMKPIFFLGNRWLAFLANFLYGLKITDEATCYKAFRSDILKSLNLECEKFEFCPEVTAKLALRKINIVEVPIQYVSRSTEKGKKLSWKDGFDATWTLLKYWLKKPKN